MWAALGTGWADAVGAQIAVVTNMATSVAPIRDKRPIMQSALGTVASIVPPVGAAPRQLLDRACPETVSWSLRRAAITSIANSGPRSGPPARPGPGSFRDR